MSEVMSYVPFISECEDVIIVNGFVNSTATHYDASVRMECNNSYKLIGDSVITCLLNGSWSSPYPVCSLIGMILIYSLTLLN